MSYAVGNVLSSVALVLLNKKVFAGGFHFPMSLTFFHFFFTIGFYEVLACAGVFERPRNLSQMERFKIAAAGFASIGFMNLSLNYNSVGFYQITKLTIIPVTLLINAMVYSVHTTAKVKISLFILVLGVGVATVTDVQLRMIGFIFGTLAVLSTAIFQIWQGTKQKEFGLSATQLQAGIATWQSIQSFMVSAFTEGFCYDSTTACVDTATDFFWNAYIGNGSYRHTMLLVLGSCFLALMVNFCSFGLIGRTSPITFQVVGHAKTCLVLVGGYVLFPAKMEDTQQFYNNVLGVCVAMVGVILYGHLKHASSQSKQDCLDYACPICVVRLIEPKYTTVEASETEGLTKG